MPKLLHSPELSHGDVFAVASVFVVPAVVIADGGLFAAAVACPFFDPATGVAFGNVAASSPTR